MKANIRPAVPPKPINRYRKPVPHHVKRGVKDSTYQLRRVKRHSKPQVERRYIVEKDFQHMMAVKTNGITRLQEYDIQYADLEFSGKERNAVHRDATEYQDFKGINEAGQTVIGSASLPVSSSDEPLYEPIVIGAQLQRLNNKTVKRTHRRRNKSNKDRRFGKRKCRVEWKKPKVRFFFKNKFAGKKMRERFIKWMDDVVVMCNHLVRRENKAKSQVVTVKMGELKKADNSNVLFTEGMSHCSSFILLSDFDKEKGIYKHRQMMHVPGSSLEMKVRKEDGSIVLSNDVLQDFLEGRKGEERKLIIAHGASNVSEYSRDITRNQTYDGRCVIRELMADHDVTVQECQAASIKVDAYGNVVD